LYTLIPPNVINDPPTIAIPNLAPSGAVDHALEMGFKPVCMLAYVDLSRCFHESFGGEVEEDEGVNIEIGNKASQLLNYATIFIQV
jgi:hypothetical protein